MNDEERIEKIIEIIGEYDIPVENFSDNQGRTRYYLDRLRWEKPNQNGGIPCILYRYYRGKHIIRRCGSDLMFRIDKKGVPHVIWDPEAKLSRFDYLKGLNGYIQYRYDEQVVDEDLEEEEVEEEEVEEEEEEVEEEAFDDKDSPWHVVLLVNENATVDELRTAYRRRCNQNHPDKIPHMSDEIKSFATEMMKKITAAYDTAKKLKGF